MKKLVAWLVLAGLLPLGCATTEPQVRPPKQPDEFIAPPTEMAKPIAYPAESMDDDPLLKKAKAGSNIPGMMKGGAGGPGSPGSSMGGGLR